MQEAQLQLSQFKAEEAMADVNKAESRIGRLERQVILTERKLEEKLKLKDTQVSQKT